MKENWFGCLNNFVKNLEDAEVLRVEPLNKFGRPLEIMKIFGGKRGYKEMVRGLEADGGRKEKT